MKKELSVFIGIFLFLAIGMHFKEWLSHPIDHVISLPTAGAYGIGAFHPDIYIDRLYHHCDLQGDLELLQPIKINLLSRIYLPTEKSSCAMAI